MIEKLKKISLSKIVFLLFITTIIVTELTLSKYETTLSKEDEVRVALMGNDLFINVITPMDLYPGSEPSIIPLIISNKENNRICEVAQTFFLKLIKNQTANIPLEITLCKDEECNEILTENAQGIYEDDEFELNAGIEDKVVLYIKAEWPKEHNHENYAFEIDYIKVQIDSTQVD